MSPQSTVSNLLNLLLLGYTCAFKSYFENIKEPSPCHCLNASVVPFNSKRTHADNNGDNFIAILMHKLYDVIVYARVIHRHKCLA